MTASTLLTVRLLSEHDIVAARQRARQIAAELGFAERPQTRLATAISEVARNATQYAGGGRVTYHVDPQGRSFQIEVVDHGDGIEGLDSILAGDYSSSTGLGLGLRGARELTDHFEIETGDGGTRVRLGLDLPADAPAIDPEWLRALSDRLAKDQPDSPLTEVLQQNRELLQAYADLEARQEETDELNRALQDASQAKDRFLAMLGHELRNMLGALRTAIEVLQRSQDVGSQERMRWIAQRQVDHLTRLVDDLLDASKIAAGKLDLHTEPCELTEQVRSELETWTSEMQAAGIELQTDLADETLAVEVDPARLAQILGNLLTNAKKFTDPGGCVTVFTRRRDNCAIIVVRDTGCGFEPANLEHILEPFAQGDAARRRMTGGLGLGLSVVRALLEAQGGCLVGSSEGPGKGATFSVELPLKEPSLLDGAPKPTRASRSSDGSSGADPGLTAERSASRTSSAPATTSAPELDSSADDDDADAAEVADDLRILLIDDHESSVEGLAELLRFDGHEVEVALDGPAGIETAQEISPQVIICDLGLPGMDGYEVVRILRRRPETAAAKIYALSGFGDSAAVDEALAAGFDAHLIKPVDFDRLEALLGDSSPSTAH